ncbi:DUF3343 domain-containing protein [Garciella nitratireducens]|uniref:Putative Se/S carrier protein-like domain-containing protein n=2 Tax=Garciella TaxID=218204 RepID=A0A1T4P9L1_9FIRM|nr:DUF3343 domain-containing protein [Garciella nitratireducens]SJZ88182.1 Protein of unknown function [Garciella nitratireducens DSM 15102]
MMKEYLAIFFTHSGAIKFERKLKSSNINCELMPVPRKLSSNCGIGAKFLYAGDIHELMDEEVEKVYVIERNKYRLVYSEE